MCDFRKGFILCKCNDSKVITHNKKSRKNKQKRKETLEYIWTLYKYLGRSKEKELGKYMFPLDDVGYGLSSDFVLKELNRRNCFDFEYTPNEGDNLIISNSDRDIAGNIEFIFREGQWVTDHYSPFEHDYEKFNNGILAVKTD